MRTYYIYKATNKINGKSYIGETVNFKSRVWQHKRCYKKENCKFHEAIKKYGFESFEWEILETCKTEENAIALEKKYILEFDTYRNGYNENKGGVGGHNARSIVRLTKNGEFVSKYDSAADAERDGFGNCDVLLCCKNKHLTCKGYMFMFEDDYIQCGAKKYVKPESKCKKRVVQCDPKGNFIAEYDSVGEAAERTGTRRTTISGVLTKQYKLANGFIFVYKEDFPIADLSIYKQSKKGRKIAQVDAKTNKIIKVYNRISEAGEVLGVNYKAIQKVIDLKNRTAYGYRWISQ